MTPNELALRDPNRPAPKEETLEQIFEAATERFKSKVEARIEAGKKRIENWGKDRARGFFRALGLRED